MRVGFGLLTAVAAGLLTACGAGAPVVKPIDEVDIESWRADLIAWPSAPGDPDMAQLYLTAVADCDNSVDDLATRMRDPAVDPTLVLVGVSYVCPGEQQKVAEAMRELHNTRPT